MEPREEIARRIRELLGVELSWELSGRPRIECELPRINWPRGMQGETTVALDPADGAHFTWPTPRFEILIANLESIGYKTVSTGVAVDGEALNRAHWNLSRERKLLKIIAAIRASVLWVGHDTLWRHIAAAVATPQVVLTNGTPLSGPVYPDTNVVSSRGGRAESAALGPLSVKEVSEAILSVLKRRKSG